MNLELPHHLHATRDLLQASLKTRSNESAPSMPQGLLEDLTRAVNFEAPASPRLSVADFCASVRAIFASPAFGASAAVILALGILSSVVLRPDSGSSAGTFRGAAGYSEAEAIQIVLIGAPEGMMFELEDSADFEDGLFTAAGSTEATKGLKGARVLVDFTSNTISAINPKGQVVYQDGLPESSTGITLAVAAAVTRL